MRRRPEDISWLAAEFLQQYRPDLPAPTITAIAATPCLINYHWPGNVRQLRNIVERLSVLYDGHTDHNSLVRLMLGDSAARALPKTEKEKLLQVIEEMNGNKTAAAKKLGLSRTTLWRKLQE